MSIVVAYKAIAVLVMGVEIHLSLSCYMLVHIVPVVLHVLLLLSIEHHEVVCHSHHLVVHCDIHHTLVSSICYSLVCCCMS